ncbi:hypothetical protein BJ170DRAFT_22596 [Xylariales sp. AK1849]|nr:hypothetical protein BJ170DRAFT_22596 [Xylariales sp. AK1849]
MGKFGPSSANLGWRRWHFLCSGSMANCRYNMPNMAAQQNDGRSNNGSKVTIRKQGRKPMRKPNHFPPPEALPEYASKDLPPLPPRSNSPSVYDAEESSRRSTPDHLLIPDVYASWDGRASTAFPGAMDEDALAMVRPPSLMTDLASVDSDQDIASPRPRYPDHKILKLKTDEYPEVSPVLTPPSSRYTFSNYAVSPMTPDGSMRGFETASEPDVSSYMNSSFLPHGSAQGSRRPSEWEDILPPSQSSLGFQPLPSKQDMSISQVQRAAFRYSDPGSPIDTSTGLGAYEFPPSQPLALTGYSQGPNGPGRDGGGLPSEATQHPFDSGVDIDTSPYSRWNQGRGLNRARDGSTPKVSFAVKETPSFSTRPNANNRQKPNPLRLDDRRTTDEAIKTPYPIGVPQSGWESDDEKREKPQRSSWGSRSQGKGNRQEESKPRGVGKLVSRVRHAGGDVMSKLSFTSEESKRDRRVEELKGKIQHQVYSVQRNVL